MDSKRPQELQDSHVDTAVSIAKSVLGAIPFSGALFAEIISVTIPNQRLDRITQFLLELDQRLEAVERERLKENKYAIDLLEDGVTQASRALSQERNQYIAVFLKKAIDVNEDSYGTKKKLLYILQELTDKDIDILRAISESGYQRAAGDHYPGSLTVGAYNRLSREEKYEYNVKQVSWGVHVATLERFGLLLAERQESDADGTSRHIDDETGLPKIIGYRASKLGEVFLSSITE